MNSQTNRYTARLASTSSMAAPPRECRMELIALVTERMTLPVEKELSTVANTPRDRSNVVSWSLSWMLFWDCFTCRLAPASSPAMIFFSRSEMPLDDRWSLAAPLVTVVSSAEELTTAGF